MESVIFLASSQLMLLVWGLHSEICSIKKEATLGVAQGCTARSFQLIRAHTCQNDARQEENTNETLYYLAVRIRKENHQTLECFNPTETK